MKIREGKKHHVSKKYIIIFTVFNLNFNWIFVAFSFSLFNQRGMQLLANVRPFIQNTIAIKWKIVL